MAKKKQTQEAVAAPESKQIEVDAAVAVTTEDTSAADNAAADEKEAADKADEPRVMPDFKYKDKDYTFTSDTPDPINIDGDLMSLAAIAEDADTIEYLIEGRNGFVQRVIKKSK